MVTEESHNLEFPSAQDYDVASCSKLCTTENISPRNDITLPLLEITDFGPPARGGHFVLFHSFLPPQPYGTQFHAVHTSPVQLVSPPLPHVGGKNNCYPPPTLPNQRGDIEYPPNK